MNNQNIAKATLTKEKLIELFSIKSLKTGFFNDPSTASCSVYYKGKALASFYDPGCSGGVSQINFKSNKHEKEFESFCNEFDLKSYFNWELKSFDFDDAFNCIIDALINEATLQKTIIKIEKACNKAIVYGTPNAYSSLGFKGISSLEQLKKYSNGLELLQKSYDEAKSALNGDQKIYNSIEQLKALGIKL